MDNTQPQWQGFGGPIQCFGLQSGHGGERHEDWEDWLRWDPTAEPTSPENSTLNEGSSKNDSPLQDPAVPVGGLPFNKYAANETLAPPLIVGEDALDFTLNNAGDDAFDFGAPSIAPTQFGFESTFQQTSNDLPNDKSYIRDQQWSNIPTREYSQDTIPVSFGPGLQPAMPTQVLQSLNVTGQQGSSASGTNNAMSNSSGSPEPARKKGGRKRKAVVEEESTEQQGDSQNGDEPPIKKTSHNVIEKRYRNNLNDKIVELRNSVPSLRAMSRANGEPDDSEDLEGLTPAHKLNKATVMAKATEYIKHLEKRNKTMSDEMDALKARLGAVEAAIGRSQSSQSSLSTSPSSTRTRQTSSSSQSPASASWQGSLQVSQGSRRVSQPNHQQYNQQHMQPTYARPPNPPVEAQQPQYVNGRGNNGVMSKLMVGSLAGLMVMEGFYEHQQPGQDTSGRGLFAAPTHLFRRSLVSASSSPPSLSTQAMLPLLKTFLVLGALLYLIAPLLSFSPRRKQKSRETVRLTPAPSLASPVEVRRKAWLTAVQTVWLPRHFLLEVVAVTVNMIKLSVRRLIGSETFTTLTGITKEDEAARIKGWDIAIDAQLAGGDAEVSYYRLLLTLMASGTLPDSPTRLMQKAVHFRVFFWEVANAGYGDLIMFKEFTARVGKIYWDSARSQQKALLDAKSRNHAKDDDDIVLLPDHLARLVEHDCDDVLTDDIIQRAYNLAWNKPSAHKTKANEAMDSVVEDHAIRSPLDAVAAWFANMTVDGALAESLSSKTSSAQEAEYLIGLAELIAPPASGTQARALTAKAVLFDKDRESNVVDALEALPTTAAPSSMNLVSQTPISPDIRTALTLAKLLSLCSLASPSPARLHAATVLASLRLAPNNFTLLTAVAAYHVLGNFSGEKQMVASTKQGLEDLAGSLRVWVGTSAGRRAGLSRRERGALVDMCLGVARKVGGWEEEDSGYGSGGEGRRSFEEPRGRTFLSSNDNNGV